MRFTHTVLIPQGGGMELRNECSQMAPRSIRLHNIDEVDWLLKKALENGSLSQHDTLVESEYNAAFPDSDYALKLLVITRFGYCIQTSCGDYRIRWVAFDRIQRRLEEVKHSSDLINVPIW
jgi:hypothetical protein